jgi:hypothetical protein
MGCIGTFVAAVGLYRDRDWGWLLGALVAGRDTMAVAGSVVPMT